MMSSLARRGGIAALVAALALAGGCSKTKTKSINCETDQDCIDQYGSQRWFCDMHASPPTCAEAARSCQSSSDCCPSQVCNLSLNVCRDKYTSCTDPGLGTGSGSCPAAGEVCQQIGYEPMGFGCTFLACQPGGVCGAGTTCFNGYCVGEPPCGGGCQPLAGQARVCVTATNYCSPVPADPSCQVTCQQGQMLVLKDPTNIFDRCVEPTPCSCVSLPPLAVHDAARYSSLAASSAYLFVSAYDGQYGDLVVHTYNKSDLSHVKSEWIDGVPASTDPGVVIGGDLTGPRNGIITPGPNVGLYSSIATSPDGQSVFVAYYDVDHSALKFIARYGGINSSWTAPITIDGGGNGDIGMYASIAVTSGGVPAIAYFRRASLDPTSNTETGLHTGLKYAVALKVNPSSITDWKIVGDIDAADRPAPACGGTCDSTKVCVNDNGADRCATPAPSSKPCTPACASTDSCVLNSAGQLPVCLTPRPPDTLRDVPLGVGLMPALAFKDDVPVVAYYDSISQTLKATTAVNNSNTSPTWASPVVLDGADAAPAVHRDTGRFPSIAIGPVGATNRIAISFQDLSSQSLLLYLSSGLTAHAAHDHDAFIGLIHVVDDGKWHDPSKTPGYPATFYAQTFPGAQSSVAFTPAGNLAVAYQDATPVDLLLSVWNPGTHSTLSHATVRAPGASGFWPRMLLDGNNAYMSSATIKAATSTLSTNQLFLDTATVP